MASQSEKAEAFRSLHVPGNPVVLYNVWDAGSARAVAAAGARAIATGSAPVAMANGYEDGEKIPLELALGNVARIAGAVDLPVSMDIEGGYGGGPAPEAVAHAFQGAVEAGAVGMNFEDQVIGGEGLYAIEAQAARIAAARATCDRAGVNAYLNARSDIFFQATKRGEAHSREMLNEAVLRARAYKDAGADGFFAVGLLEIDMIAELCEAVEMPVNIIALPGAPDAEALAKAGVARISYGPVPYREMIAWFEEKARVALGTSGT